MFAELILKRRAGNSDVCKFNVTIFAPTLFVTGRVIDADTGTPLTGATVAIGEGRDSETLPPRGPPPQQTTTKAPRTTRGTTRAPWWPVFTEGTTRRPPPPPPTTTTQAQRITTARGRFRRESVQKRQRRAEVVSSNEGTFVFEVPVDPDTYTIEVEFEGRTGEVDVVVETRNDIDVNVPIPDIQDPSEYQFITTWIEDSLPSHNNFNAHLQTSFDCQVYFGEDFCFDDFSDAFLNQDFRNSDNGAGPETITIFAGSTVSQYELVCDC